MGASEFARIALLRKVFGEAPPPALGIGDDAAVLPDPRDLVATVDASVEGVHFRRDLIDLEGASARACEAAMSDIAAMGGSLEGPGCGLLLAWSLPPTLTDADFAALAHGARRAADRAGTRILGGNLTRGLQLSLTTTVLGRVEGPPLRRDAARPGDVVATSGALGLSALGLSALFTDRSHDPRFATAVAKWREPRARLAEGAAIRGRATACIDLSDGLAQDARHLAEASGVALVFEAEAILGLLPPTLRELPDDAAWQAAAHGGEDYELLATGHPEAFGPEWTLIGSVRPGHGVFVSRHGAEAPIAPQGWDHFTSR